MSHLVFVCTGNVCRSPFAERLSTAMFADAGLTGWKFSSLGTGALEGHPMDELMRERLEARGGSGEGFAARQATAEGLREADLVITMQSGHHDWVLEEMPGLITRTFSLGQAVRFTVEDAGARRGGAYLDALHGHRSRARRRDDVQDPYRRGPEAADRAADEITKLLRVFLPRLVG